MSGRTFCQKLAETRGTPNPLAAIFKGSEAVLSFFEKHELPVENHRPVNPRHIHFNHYQVLCKDGIFRTKITKAAPTFIREEVGEPVDYMDPLAILLRKEEDRLMGGLIERDVEDDDDALIRSYLECLEGSDEDDSSLTLAEWLAKTRSADDDIELSFTNAEEKLLAQLSDATPQRKSEPLRKPRAAFFSRRRR